MILVKSIYVNRYFILACCKIQNLGLRGTSLSLKFELCGLIFQVIGNTLFNTPGNFKVSKGLGVNFMCVSSDSVAFRHVNFMEC